ncbi:hypothetical protein RIR_jg10802.t1 [Rhizophagus irregularis DAOM 181602=DAOM 197198]|nr:hypothetical protein RIR_jg10802.t1 [Rhizophagus irregularis DAOM 181602=DAOM 197198]
MLANDRFLDDSDFEGIELLDSTMISDFGFDFWEFEIRKMVSVRFLEILKFGKRSFELAGNLRIHSVFYFGKMASVRLLEYGSDRRRGALSTEI